MSPLQVALDEYLAVRRTLGYKLRLSGRLLQRFVSERGKMVPSRITAVSTKKQRALAQAVKRARFLALLPYAVK